MKLNKIEIAYRQGVTAIEMFFEDRDPVSIHSLASAAYNIFRDVARINGSNQMLLKQRSLEFVAPTYHKKWLAHMNKFENFFKHADMDHDSEIEFNPEVTEFYLYDVTLKIKEHYGEKVPMANLFMVWFAANKLKLFWSEEEKAKQKEFFAAADHYSKLGKARFKEYFLPLANTLNP